MNRRGRAVFVLAAGLVGAYYLWGVGAATDGFDWKRDLDGYYDQLARGFVNGHLYLPNEPLPELLAQANPWDPNVPDSIKMFDAVLYHRHYYLYHGAGPALMLFAPWRRITHHDLPETFGVFLFCFGGFLFSAAALVTMLQKDGSEVPPPVLALLLVALGLCQGVPFLLNRVWVYEVAIAAGYFCLSAGVFFLLRARSLYAFALSGLMFGVAISCRPHLGIAGVLALMSIGYKVPRRALAFCIPFALAGLLVGVYNFERFRNPLEFGNKYLLGGANQTEVRLSAANVPAGLLYLIVSPPVFSPVFPWVRLPSPPHKYPRPATYTVEPTAGALFLAPFFPLAFVLRRRRFIYVSAGLVLLFITATGWSTQRYEVDFLPLLVLCSLVVVARARGTLWIAAGLAIGFAVVVNLALGVAGPNDEMIRTYPARFVKIAGWFSPIARYRPMLNPPIDVRFSAPSGPLPPAYRQYLFRAGRYGLYVESLAGVRTLVSSCEASQVTRPLEDTHRAVEYRVVYSPASEEIHVSGDGKELIGQKIGTLVAAPSEISAGS